MKSLFANHVIRHRSTDVLQTTQNTLQIEIINGKHEHFDESWLPWKKYCFRLMLKKAFPQEFFKHQNSKMADNASCI